MENTQEQKTIVGFRLSPLQQRLWKQLPHSTGFGAQAIIQIDGEMDFAILSAAIHDVVARHEILRTTFQPLPAPAQVITTAGVQPGRHFDWRDFSAAQQNAALTALWEELKTAPFDLVNGPVLRLATASFAANKHFLLVALPALCADAAGLNNFTREISRAYQARFSGGEYAGEAAQYADLAEWQNDLLEGEAGEAGRAFWRKQNFYPLPPAQLPWAKSEAAETGFQPQVFREAMRPELAQKVFTLAEQRQVSVATVLLAGFEILLWRLTGGENEIVVGAGHHGRKYDELKEALGLFAKFLPVRVSLRSSSRFNEILVQFAQAAQDVDTWQDFFSWEMLNGKLDEAAPFLPFCFDFIEAGEKFAAGAAIFSVLQHDVCVDRFHLKLIGVQHQNTLRLELHYDANLYAAEDAQRFVAQFQALLESVAAQPHALISELNILPAAERQRLVFDFNDTAAEYPKDRCIHQVIEEQAHREPDRVAVIFNEQVLTYGELNARANQLAHRLRTMGVGPNVLVGICLERSLEMIVGVLAILKAGGAYLPLDPAYPEERLRLMLADTQAPVLLTKQALIEKSGLKMDDRDSQSSILDPRPALLCLDADWNAIAQESRDNPTAGAIPENLVYIIYTSGSTGKPKGVMISHQDLMISNLARIAYFKQPVHKFLLLSSLSFDSSVVGIFWTLCEGGALFLVPEAQQKNMIELTEIIATNRISHLLTLPSLYALILEYAKAEQIACLQTVIVAGEACPKKMVEQHRAALPGTALFSEYGATETTVFSSVYDCLQQSLNLAPVGDPIANAQMYVLDSNQQPQPFNIPGEVYFGGDALAKGYWNRPELTAEKFIPHPFSAKPGERLYKSGDLARHLPNGDLEFLGRIDNQVKIRGFRIELEEIEAVLGQHPAIREVAIEARSSNGGKRLSAYVALSPEQPASIAELRQYLAERLPDYMVPAQFVKLDTLPKNPNGKIDRRALPDPGEERPELEENFVAAQTMVEKKLAEIWAEVLRIAKVGIHDNFFELGGDSILSIQIISKANRAGLRFTPVQLFQHQTIGELAKVAGAAQTIHAEQHAVTGALPLTPIQHWFFAKALPAPDHWNVSLLLEVRGDMPAAHLQHAAQKLLEQHDALRMRYIRAAGWQQTIGALEDTSLFDRVDLSALRGDEQRAAIEEQTQFFQAKLNLGRGPLMRFVLFDRGAGHSPYLLWVLHHLVCDIVSWRIMLEDLQTLLEQLRRNAPLQLPAKTTSFKYWAEQVAEYAQSPNVHGELDYWLSVVPAQPPALPFDGSNDLSANTEESTGAIKLALDENETRALLQEMPKIYNTQINDVLLTALAQTFAKWTGESSVLIDMEGHGREDVFTGVDLSRTVGWFTVFYPVLLKLESASDPGTALRGIKEQLRRIPNRGFNYSLLRYLNRDPEIAAKMQRLPAAPINFNYLGQFDQTLQESSLFGLVQETNIYDRSPAGIRSHVLEIVGTVIGGCLQIEWSYSRNLHRAMTIENLAKSFLAHLRAIIQPGRAVDAKDFTASDFADFNWDQTDLENIAAAIVNSKR